jgi:hypothetical protein
MLCDMKQSHMYITYCVVRIRGAILFSIDYVWNSSVYFRHFCVVLSGILGELHICHFHRNNVIELHALHSYYLYGIHSCHGDT